MRSADKEVLFFLVSPQNFRHLLDFLSPLNDALSKEAALAVT